MSLQAQITLLTLELESRTKELAVYKKLLSMQQREHSIQDAVSFVLNDLQLVTRHQQCAHRVVNDALNVVCKS